MMKKVFALIISTAICLSLFSGCGESAVGEAPAEEETTSATIAAQTSNEISLTEITTEATTKITTETTLEITTEATSETTIEATVTAEETTTERELTADEVELMNSMPDIVFVLSHHYSYVQKTTNILGFYIMKDGSIKMYDFRNREPEKYYNVLDVIDELETAVCSELEGVTDIKPENIKNIPESEMVEYYKILLQIDKDSEIIYCENPVDAELGEGELYGIRYDENGEREIITLTGWGDYYDFNNDPLAEQLLPHKLFGRIFFHLSY